MAVKKTPAQLAEEARLRAMGIPSPANPVSGPSAAAYKPPSPAYVPPAQGSVSAPAPAIAPAKQAAIDQYVQTGYVPGANATSAYDTYQQQQANKPADYASPYDAQIAAAFDGIMNRDKFNYDMNGDPLYQQMKDQYLQQGNMAMQDTMGQAASLTGGYGNSYAASAGQQAYGQQVQALNNNMPALRDRAYQQYADQGSEMYNQVGLMQNLDTAAYGKSRDKTADWQTMLGMAQNNYQNERSFDYGQQQDAVAQAFAQEQFGYQKSQDTQAQQNYQGEFDYQKQLDTAQQNFQNAQFEYQKATDARDFTAAEYWQTKTFDYQKQLDTAQQAFTQEQFSYQKSQDTQANAFAQEQFDYGKTQDTAANNLTQQQMTYQQQQDAIANAFNQEQVDYGKTQDTQAQAFTQEQWGYQKQQDALTQASKSSGGGGTKPLKLDFKTNEIALATNGYVKYGLDGMNKALESLYLQGYSEDELSVLGNSIMENNKPIKKPAPQTIVQKPKGSGYTY